MKWEKDALFKGWLKSHKDPKKAYCSACKREMKAKQSVLALHANSRGHNQNVHQLHDPQLQTLEQLSSVRTANIESKIKEAELKLAGFIAEHNLPFLVMDHLAELLSSVCLDSVIAANVQCKRTKTTCIIQNVLGPHFHSEVVNAVKQQPYSLLVDESTDMSTMKQLCVVVRYYDESLMKVTSRFFSLIDVARGDADTLFEVLKVELDKDMVTLKNIVGYASDGANVMMGNNNSFRTKIENESPCVFVMNCICHSAHLVASYACATLPRQAEEFVRDIYSYFNHSAHRLADLAEFQHFTDTEPHKLLHPCQTRWLSLHQRISRLMEQWHALTKYFAYVAREEKVIKAEKLHGLLCNRHFKLVFYFLNFILPKLTEFNLLFQSTAPTLHLLHKKVQLLYEELLSCYMQPTYIRNASLSSIDPEDKHFTLPLNALYLGVDVAAEMIKPEILSKRDIVQDFLSRSHDFLATAAVQIKKRFPIDDLVIEQLQVLNLSCSHQHFPSLIPLALRFPNLIQQSELQQLDNEWRRLTFAELPFNFETMPV